MNRIALFVLLSLFWVMLTWNVELPGSTYTQDFGVGLAAAAMVTWIVGEDRWEFRPWWNAKSYAWGVIYVFVLAGYVIKANIEVAYLVLHPKMPIRPGIIRVKTCLRRPAARAILGNSITLCPGTLTLDIWEDGTMMVHSIYVRSEDEEEASRQIIGRFEWFIQRIFE